MKPIVLAIAIKTCSSSILKEDNEKLKSTYNLLRSRNGDVENPSFDHYCINNDSFSFLDGNGNSRDCSWLLHETDAQRKSKFCSLKLIQTNCERSCDVCTCQDDESFTFLIKDSSDANNNTRVPKSRAGTPTDSSNCSSRPCADSVAAFECEAFL